MRVTTLLRRLRRLPYERRSLRWRLLFGLMVIVLIFWALVGLSDFVVYGPRHPPWDKSLQLLADRILSSVPPDIGTNSAIPQVTGTIYATASGMPQPEIETAAYQVWLDRKLFVRSKNAPASPLAGTFRSGFANTTVAGILWRAYATSDATGRIHVEVGISPEQIDNAVHQVELIWSIGTSLLLGLPMLAIYFVIWWSFIPVANMRRLVEKRQPFDLTPLPRDSLPAEVRPLVDSFNGLLQQLDNAVTAERQFIADAAHELRTPLAVLAALAQVALRSRTLDEKNEVLHRLSAGVERSARLSEQLLDLARLEAGAVAPSHAPVDVSQIISIIVRDFETDARQREQSIVIDNEPCWIFGSLDDIGIMIRNLVDNACRYSGIGSRILLSCRPEIRRQMPCVNLTVADNGPGVGVADRERIFDRFFRVAGNPQPGSGIGLSLVAGIAKSHYAELEVGEASDGRGYKIAIYFQRCFPSPAGVRL